MKVQLRVTLQKSNKLTLVITKPWFVDRWDYEVVGNDLILARAKDGAAKATTYNAHPHGRLALTPRVVFGRPVGKLHRTAHIDIPAEWDRDSEMVTAPDFVSTLRALEANATKKVDVVVPLPPTGAPNTGGHYQTVTAPRASRPVYVAPDLSLRLREAIATVNKLVPRAKADLYFKDDGTLGARTYADI